MDGNRVFTLDTANFGGLPDYMETMKDGGLRTAITLVGLDLLLYK